MKRQIKMFAVMTMIFSLFFASCKKDDKVEFLSPDEAKVELRSASQDVMAAADQMMETPAMSAMMNFMDIMGMNDEFRKAFKDDLLTLENKSLHTLNSLFREKIPQKASGPDIDPTSKGVFEYNFLTQEFDLTNPSVNYLRFLFPADEAAYFAQSNNANLTISNLEFVTITYTDDWGTWTEELISKASVSLLVDGDEVMTLNFQASYDSEGMPSSASFTLGMAPYQLTMSMSGSNDNFTSTMSFKKNAEVLLAYNLKMSYDSDYGEIEKVSGFVQITPLKFEGNIFPSELEWCDDVDCMNENIDVKLKHTAMNKYIGRIEFRMYTDPYWEDTYPEPVIVYEDGTWEFLFEVFDSLFEQKKTMKLFN
jgi:hypothetical protein